MFLAIFLFLGGNIFFRWYCCSLRKPTVAFRCVTNRPILRRRTVSVREVGAGGLQRAGCRRDGAVRSDGFGCGTERSCRKEAGTSGRAIRDCFRAVKSRRLPVGRMGCAGRCGSDGCFSKSRTFWDASPVRPFVGALAIGPLCRAFGRVFFGFSSGCGRRFDRRGNPPFSWSVDSVCCHGRCVRRILGFSCGGMSGRRSFGCAAWSGSTDGCGVIDALFCAGCCASVARMMPHGVSHGCCCAEHVARNLAGDFGKTKKPLDRAVEFLFVVGAEALELILSQNIIKLQTTDNQV